VSILLFYTYVEPLWSEMQQQTAIKHCIAEVGAMLPFSQHVITPPLT